MTATKGKMIGRYTEEALLKRAKEVVEEKAKGSDFFDEDAEKDMPRFKRTGEYIFVLMRFGHLVTMMIREHKELMQYRHIHILRAQTRQSAWSWWILHCK